MMTLARRITLSILSFWAALARTSEGDFAIRRRAFKQVDLDARKRMLRRDGEVERASAVGRHKEADVQMKSYASAFGAVLQKSLPDAPAGNSLAQPSLPLHSAANFQRAVAKEKRSQEG